MDKWQKENDAPQTECWDHKLGLIADFSVTKILCKLVHKWISDEFEFQQKEFLICEFQLADMKRNLKTN